MEQKDEQTLETYAHYKHNLQNNWCYIPNSNAYINYTEH